MKRYIYIGIMVVLMIAIPREVRAEDMAEEYGEFFDFGEIQELLDEHGSDVEFEHMTDELMQGNLKEGADSFLERMSDILFLELKVNQRSIKNILIITIITAIFSNFGQIFAGSQVSETGFAICYVSIMTYLIGSFTALTYIAYDVTRYIIDFIKVLLPVYTMSVSIGQTNALSFYEMALVIIAIIDFICLKLVLPAIDIYIAIGLVNNLNKKDYFSKACELIKNSVSFVIKMMYTVVMGINIIQKMFQPLSGNIRGSALKNTVNAISGMSDNSIAELIYGTGKILRSSIGGAGIIVLVAIAIIPIIKIIVFIFTYQMSNAIIQPISDKRINECITIVSNGAVLMLRTVFAELVLMAVTIAIVCL